MRSPFGTSTWYRDLPLQARRRPPAPSSLNIPKGTRAKRVGTVDAIGNDIGIALFALSAFLLYRADEYKPSAAALTQTGAGAGATGSLSFSASASTRTLTSVPLLRTRRCLIPLSDPQPPAFRRVSRSLRRPTACNQLHVRRCILICRGAVTSQRERAERAGLVDGG